MKLKNPYTLQETVEKLRYVLIATSRLDSLALLDKAIAKSKDDENYLSLMEQTLTRGSTVELRELLSPFGEYFSAPRSELPFYPHADAVNGIDTSMHYIKLDAIRPGDMLDCIVFTFSYEQQIQCWSI